VRSCTDAGRIRVRSLLVRGLLVLLLVGVAGSARADYEQLGAGWLQLMGQGDLGSLRPPLSRLRWMLDGQVRFREDTDGFQQSIVRPGIGWAVTGPLSLWLGYAWIRTSPAMGDDNDENRLFQQLLWTPKIGFGPFQARTRLEQRWLSNGDDTGWRFRQFFKISRPLAFEPRLSLVGYDEVFVDLNDTDWGQDAGFDQNRFWVGFSWRFDAEGRAVAELGYLNQFVDNRRGPDSMNHIASLNLLFR
jgi:hypothetical protein